MINTCAFGTANVFQVGGVKFNYAQYDKGTPGLFKVENN
jgi:hypothetical protein